MPKAKITALITTLSTYLALAFNAYAQGTGTDCFNQNGIATLRCIPYFTKNLINALFLLSGISAVFFIIISGIRLMLSGGDPIKVEKARSTFTYALIGLAIILLSFVILQVVSVITGTNCIIKVLNCA